VARTAYERAASGGAADADAIRQLSRRVIGRWVPDNYRRWPMIIRVLAEV
jgi:ribonuclease J